MVNLTINNILGLIIITVHGLNLHAYKQYKCLVLGPSQNTLVF